ncbi:hypothetical protein [Streptomyces griseofuscus]|uniref:hypothetical protein n=1 Tax=Streptomyces griseofuscus TaxID=146922 RepID=UPI000F64DAA2|nr:hypothetical protein [Streptomyces griseofuscus]
MSARRDVDVVGSAALPADGRCRPGRRRIADAASGALGDYAAVALSILAALAGLAALDRRFAVAGLLAAPLRAHTLRWYMRTSQPLYAAGRTAEGPPRLGTARRVHRPARPAPRTGPVRPA